ncbi:MAG: glycine cleavage system aminomethyltransferase GcvT [Treponema sp.]|nr:glycine cleavage system aminomethyltransferase GcvT [Treponema sp.]
MEKKTPLYQWHLSHGGKIVPFAGYLLPIQYERGLIAEHLAVREKAGLFDVSHMGEFVVQGPGALAALQHILTNDFSNMSIGRVRYTLMCNEKGGVIDDLVVCRMAEDRYMLVVNAANREKDVAWIRTSLDSRGSSSSRGSLDSFRSLEVSFEDSSDSLAQIALQGPQAEAILSELSADIPEKYYTLIENGKTAGINCIVSRTGYTGEAGFELYCSLEEAEKLWEALLEAGKDRGLIPCGLGARDTLRLEAAMPLYGHEMDETVTPFEAGLGFAVKMSKADFTGKKALLGREKPSRVRAGLRVTGKGIIREGAELFRRGEPGGASVGKTTSGTFCPYLKEALAMALVDAACAEPGTRIEADVRGRRIEAEICALPFYR